MHQLRWRSSLCALSNALQRRVIARPARVAWLRIVRLCLLVCFASFLLSLFSAIRLFIVASFPITYTSGGCSALLCSALLCSSCPFCTACRCLRRAVSHVRCAGSCSRCSLLRQPPCRRHVQLTSLQFSCCDVDYYFAPILLPFIYY